MISVDILLSMDSDPVFGGIGIQVTIVAWSMTLLPGMEDSWSSSSREHSTLFGGELFINQYKGSGECSDVKLNLICGVFKTKLLWENW